MVQIHAVSAPQGESWVLGGALSQLIESVGDPRFAPRLFKAAHESINCAHISAFALDCRGRPTLIFAEDCGHTSEARQIGDRYVERYWRMDPVRSCGLASSSGRYLVEVAADDILYPDYRHDCYTAVSLAARISVCEVRAYGMVRLNYYRDVAFKPAEKDAIAESVNVLVPLLWRHGRRHFAELSERCEPDFDACLRNVAPRMPQREREICALIAAGLTSERIALQLGVSRNTILTYRKRAYGRLQINTQNELMRLLMKW